MNTANLFQKEKDDFHYNACVGNNGWTGIKAYIHGYQAATLVMLESVLKSVNSRKDVPEGMLITGMLIQLYIQYYFQRDII